MTSEYGGQTAIEHLHRYMLAREFCRGKHVLDVASGEGYGAAMLAQVAGSVVGVEVDADVVTHATENYTAPALRYLCGDARDIPVDDGSVDVAVSFETIEHFDQQDQFLSEIRRVLRPGGLFIVSTPDRDTYSPVDQPPNAFHVRELTREEFTQMLGRRFGNVAMCWQRAMTGSALLPGPGIGGPDTVCFERRGDAHFEASPGFARPRYLIALCSDAPLPAVPASIYIDYSQLDTHELLWQAKVDAEVGRLQALQIEAAETRARFEAAETSLRANVARAEGAEALVHRMEAEGQAREAALQAADARMQAAETAMRAAEAARHTAQEAARAARNAGDAANLALRQSCQAEVDSLKQELAIVRSSTSWRVTAPLRRIAGSFSRSR